MTALCVAESRLRAATGRNAVCVEALGVKALDMKAVGCPALDTIICFLAVTGAMEILRIPPCRRRRVFAQIPTPDVTLTTRHTTHTLRLVTRILLHVPVLADVGGVPHLDGRTVPLVRFSSLPAHQAAARLNEGRRGRWRSTARSARLTFAIPATPRPSRDSRD